MQTLSRKSASNVDILLRMFAVLLFVSMLGVGCNPNQSVSGQVFIVTEGGENIRLGLVDVLLLDRTTCEQYQDEEEMRASARDKGEIGSEVKFLQELFAPKPVQKSTTDADGKFHLDIPNEGKFGIFARASRRVGLRTENYVWFFWIRGDRAETNPLILSNHNLISAYRPSNIPLWKSAM